MNEDITKSNLIKREGFLYSVVLCSIGLGYKIFRLTGHHHTEHIGSILPELNDGQHKQVFYFAPLPNGGGGITAGEMEDINLLLGWMNDLGMADDIDTNVKLTWNKSIAKKG